MCPPSSRAKWRHTTRASAASGKETNSGKDLASHLLPLPACLALQRRSVESYYQQHGWHTTNLLPFVDHGSRLRELEQAQKL